MEGMYIMNISELCSWYMFIVMPEFCEWKECTFRSYVIGGWVRTLRSYIPAR